MIIVNAENDPEGQARIAAFRRGLQELRWTEGSNLLIDYRWGVSEPVRARALVGELVSFAPDVVVVNGTPGLAALQARAKCWREATDAIDMEVRRSGCA